MVHTIDLDFLQHPLVIAAGLVDGQGGAAIVDPGPASSLDGLKAGLASHGRTLDDVEAVLLTHIHLDHAGATGSLVRDYPRIRVYVHERGAPHVIDPSKLLASATRLYGAHMGLLWGDVLPVPADRIQVLLGGEQLSIAGRTIDVAYTPGHASHHVSYFDRETGTAFAGDTAGIRIAPALHVVAPTPPPDIDLEAWSRSLDVLRGWAPSRLFLTHFGSFDDAESHLDRLQVQLDEMAKLVRASFQQPADDDAARMAGFREALVRSIREAVPDEKAVERYELAVPSDHCWMGLARYWRKRGLY